MNIAILSTGFIGTGKEATCITLLNFAKELSRSGHNLVVIAEKREESSRNEELDGISFYRVGGFKFFKFYNRILGHALGVRRMQKSKNIKFDIIHTFSAAHIFVLRGFLARIFARKAILIHTVKSYSRNRLGRSFYRLLNLADVITVPTKVFAEKLIEGGVKKEKIFVIRSHIDTEKFIPADKDELKKKLGYVNKKIIFYYGAMWDLKGSDYLVESIPKIIKENYDAFFVFAPRNIDWRIEGYQKKIKKMNMEKHCDFILRDVKIEDYVAMADMVVLPYPNLIGTEGNPSCMLEAMACKTPVITTDLPELREIAEPEKEVLMAKPKDSDSLAAEINRLLKDKKLQEKLAENAYEKSKGFNDKIITKQFLELYEKILKLNQ